MAATNEYRLFFLNERAGIEARQGFCAEDDAEAQILAALFFGACSDGCTGYELWSRTRLVVAARTGPRADGERLTLEDISEAQQQNLVELEDAFQRSHWRLAASRRLLEATEIARERIASSKKPL